MKRVLLAAAFVVLAASAATVQQGGPAPAHFHHVHANSTDPAKTQAFYEKTFGAQPVRFKDRTDALFTSRGFILRAVRGYGFPTALRIVQRTRDSSSLTSGSR